MVLKSHWKQRIGGKALPAMAGAILLAALVAGVLALVWSSLHDRPKSPRAVQRQIASYLGKQSGQSDFAIALPAALTNQPASAATNTNRAGRTGRSDRTDRNRNELSRAFQENLGTAPDYKTIYRLIGRHLNGAGQLLQSDSSPLVERGVFLAMEAARAATDDAYDPWLAARIAEGYLWPQAGRIGRDSNSRINAERLLGTTERAFQEAGEPANIVRNFKLLIEHSGDKQRADMARYQLARFLQNEGDYQQALDCLKEIQPGENDRWQGRIAQLEKELASKLK